MNYYPGQGLTVGTAILGSTVGQAYPEGTVFSLTKLYGKILTPSGTPVGSAGTTLSSSVGGTSVVDTWKGSQVTASISPADESQGSIISVDRLTTTTNESGYFEIYIIKGLTAVVSCPSFGKSVTVDTTGLDTVDLSTYF